MRITRIDLDGFGVFHDQEFVPVPGLTLFRGNNETGKTTLLAFVRSIFFGFETNRHPALAGGRRGGRIDIELQDGRTYTVERYSDRGGAGNLAVRAADGTHGGEDLLAQLFRGVEAKLYRNVFAFGLSELQELSNLTEGELAARIYGAGTGTGSASSLALERQLADERESIFKAAGQHPALNVVLKRLEEVTHELHEMNPPAVYAAKHERLRQVGEELATLHRRDAEIAAELVRLDRIVKGWPTWLELRDAEQKLARLGDVSDVPPSVAAEERALGAAVESAERELIRARARHETLGQQLGRLQRDPTVLERRQAIEALRLEHQADSALRDQLQVAESQHPLLEASVSQSLQRIGPDWNEQRVTGFDDSIAVRGMVTGSFKELVDTAVRERDLVATDVRMAEREAEDIGQRLARLRSEVSDALEDVDGRREAAVRDLEIALDRRVLLRTLPRTGTAPSTAPGLARWPLATLVAGVLLSSIALAFSVPWLQVAIPAAAGLLLTIALWVVARRFVPSPAPASSVDAELARTEDAVRRLVAELHVSPDADRATIQTLRADLEQLRSREAARIATAQEIGREEAASRTTAEHLQALRLRLSAADEHLRNAREQWAEWLQTKGLPETLDRESAVALVDAVTTAKQRIADLRRLDEQIARLRAQHAEHVDAARPVLAELGAPTERDRELDASILAVSARLDTAREVEREYVRLRADWEQAQAECDSLAANSDEARRAHDALFVRLGASDAEDLGQKLALAQRRREMLDLVSRAKSALAVLSGPEEAQARLTADLAGIADIAAIKSAHQRLEDERQGSAARLRELSEESGALKKELADLETSFRSIELRQELEDLLALAKDHADRFVVVSLAENLLRVTREHYEREHRPAVIEAAEKYLATISEGRYVRIVAPVGKEIEGLERPDRQVVPLNGLSRGTAEQLYFALRLAMIDLFARSTESLPVVMDDVLVNFDDPRHAQAARVIEEFSKRNQVLYFTCHATSLRADREFPLEVGGASSARPVT